MIFEKVDHIIVFGGSRLTAELSVYLQENGAYAFDIFTCERQLNDNIYADNITLRKFFNDRSIPFHSTENINENQDIKSIITDHSLGFGLGEAWSFSKNLIDRFDGRLLDFMGIRLPQYRGGAHYTWQILRGNRISCCNLQIINEEMIQGVFDSGEIVKSKEYLFPSSARIPEDYFEFAVRQEISFIKEFLEEIKEGQDFKLINVQENFGIYFPRLYTDKHGYINWEWDTRDIESFICAFDEPYAGASTFIANKKVHLKKCCAEFNDGPFHPFQAGLIYKVYNDAVFIATISGTLIVHRVINEGGKDVLQELHTGQRFYTPRKYLEEAMTYSAEYSVEGIVEENK